MKKVGKNNPKEQEMIKDKSRLECYCRLCADKWAKEKKVKINPEYTVEVYPKWSSDKQYP